MVKQLYDLLVIGAGPAGLTASIYASRYKLSNLVVGKTLGGMMTYAHKVENYPGFVSISGIELGQKMGEQVKALGAQIIAENVGRIEKTEGGFRLKTESNRVFEGKALVVATGTERRKLGIPGEKEYLGKGVSYCSNCDAPFFKDKTVAVVGGADAACSGTLHIAEYARKVYLIYRGEALRAEPAWVEEIKKNKKIEVVYQANLVEIIGDSQKVTGVKLDQDHQGEPQLSLDGVFIEIGGVPLNSLLQPLGVEVNDSGYVKVGPQMETNLPGLYSAGDVADRCGEFQQITVACSEGSLAASSVFKYLKGQSAPKITGG